MDLRRLARMDALDDSFPLPLDAPFTTLMARQVGISVHQLTWMTEHHLLRHPLRGVYVDVRVADTIEHRCACLRLVMPDDCVVVDRHAGWLHGAEMVLAPNEHLAVRPITVYRPSGHGRLRNSLADSGERNLRPRDITEIGGLAVTTPLRTALDLGRNRWPGTALSALDALLRLGAFTHAELLDGVERFRGMRWVTTLRAVAPLADARSQSPGESVLRLRWLEAGLPRPVPQHEVWVDGVLIAVLDLASPEVGYAAEYDGAEWHSSPEQQEHDRRRRRAVSDEGWVVDPFVCSDLFGRQADPEARLRYGMDLARRQNDRLAS